MNAKRVVLGGLVAAVVMFVLDGIGGALFTAHRYEALQRVGYFKTDPRYPFLPLWALCTIGMGLGFAWLYAVARPRLGAGPKTAALIGLVVGGMCYVPINIVHVSWYEVGRFLPLYWLVSGILFSVVGSLVAGALYKEKAP
jgi:hypothetical protein